MTTWNAIYDSNIGNDFASTLAAVGPGQTLVNGWVDLAGSTWKTSGGNLSATTGTGTIQNYVFLLRPQSEDAADMRVIQTLPASALTSGQNMQFYLRCSRGQNNYLTGYCFLIAGAGTFSLYKVINGTATILINAATISGFNLAHSYTLDGSVAGNAFNITITDVTTSTVAYSNTTFTDSSITTPGSFGLTCAVTSTTVVQASRVQTFIANGFRPSLENINLGVTTAITLKGYGTAWTSGTTFSISGGTGVSISSQSVNVGAQTASLSIVGGSALGTLTITDNTDGYSCTVNAANIAAVSDPGFFFPPNGWVVNGSVSASTNAAGNYFYFWFTGTACTLTFSTSTPGGNTYSNAYVRWAVDGGPFTDTNIANTPQIVMLSGGTNTLHKVVVYYKGRTSSVDAWNTPSNAFTVTGMSLNASATTSTPTVRANTMLVYGDSRVEGYDALSNGSGAASAQDATAIEAAYIAEAMNCEYAMRAFAGIDFTITGQTNVPGIFVPGSDSTSSWDKYWAGQSMLSGGQYVNQPNYIFVLNIGGNANTHGVSTTTEQAAINGFMTALRAAAPAANILFTTGDYCNYYAAQYTAALAAYQLATPDALMYLIPNTLTGTEIASINDVGAATIYSYDGTHPNTQLHGIIATHLMNSIYPILNPAPAVNQINKPSRDR